MMHLAHFKDGYPLCWDMDQEGEFEATRDEADVDCEACLHFMRD